MSVGALCAVLGLGEGVDHLFVHCLVISRLWVEIISWFGVDWVMPYTVKEVIFTWDCSHYDDKRRLGMLRY